MGLFGSSSSASSSSTNVRESNQSAGSYGEGDASNYEINSRYSTINEERIEDDVFNKALDTSADIYKHSMSEAGDAFEDVTSTSKYLFEKNVSNFQDVLGLADSVINTSSNIATKSQQAVERSIDDVQNAYQTSSEKLNINAVVMGSLLLLAVVFWVKK